MERFEDSNPPGDVRIVVGLGNPGRRYERTRHNVGFAVMDRLAARLGGVFDQRLDTCVAFRWLLDGAVGSPEGGAVGSTEGGARSGRSVELWCAKPFTYMNRSGAAVLELLSKCGDSQAGILIAYDDFHLPLGKLRFRPSGTLFPYTTLFRFNRKSVV